MLRRLVRIQLGLAVAFLLALLEVKKAVKSGKSTATTTWNTAVKATAGDVITVPSPDVLEWNSIESVKVTLTVESGAGLSGTSILSVEGTLTISSGATMTHTGNVVCTGTCTINAPVTFGGSIKVAAKAKLKLAAALKTTGKEVKTEGEAAELKTEGNEMEAPAYQLGGSGTINIENSTVKATGGSSNTGWTVLAEVGTFNAAGSTLELLGAGAEEHKMEGGGKSYAALIGTKFWTLFNNNSFTTWAINTKEAAEGQGLRLANGSVQTVSGAITTNGTAAKKARLESDKAGTRAAVKGSGSNKKTTGTLIVKDIEYTGGGTWYIEGEGSEGTNTAGIVFGPEPGGGSFSREAADTISVAEGTSRIVTLPRSVSESIAIAEATSQIVSTPRAASEGISVAETTSRIVTAPRSAADSISVAESTAASRGSSRTAADTASISEGTSRLLGLMRSSTDTASIAEAVSRIVSTVRTATESVSVAEGTTVSHGRSRSTAESITVAEGASRLLGLVRSSTELVNVTDSASRLVGMVRAAADTISIVDVGIVAGGVERLARVLHRISLRRKVHHSVSLRRTVHHEIRMRRTVTVREVK